jgi:hypothetical protein
VRFREDKPGDLAKAREAVTKWREEHPDGTAEQLVAGIGGQFHRDYGPVLRALLFRADLRSPSVAAGITIIAGEDR